MMSSSSQSRPFCKNIDGFLVPGMFSTAAFRSALAYRPRPDDLFIVTYPKCGTTWVQNIVACIFRRGEPFRDVMEFFTQTPYLELAGASAALTMKRPGAIKTHLPFHMAPYSPEAKYIFVARNPKDCCVSFYHHAKFFGRHEFEEGTFDDFFELFIRGEVESGDYFDTLLSWYEHRNDPNVLFLTYEQLKEDTKKYILEIAGFIGEKYREDLERDHQLLETVIQFSGFAYLKEFLSRNLKELGDLPRESVLNNPDLPEGIRHTFSQSPFKNVKSSDVPFARKGIVGDWKNYFSEEQSRRMNEKFREKTKGTDIPRLWEKYI